MAPRVSDANTDQVSSADHEDADQHDIEHVELPEEGDDHEQGDDAVGQVESSNTDQGDKDSLLSVVRDVVDKNKPSAASPADQTEDQETGLDGQSQPKDIDNENYSDVGFHKHPRFKQLLGERNAYRTDAQRYQNVQGFLDNQGLSAEEAANTLVIAGLMKTNRVEAWKQLKPIVQQLLIDVGEVLSPELQQRVTAGELSHDAALEISRAHALQRSTEVSQAWANRRQQTEQAQAHSHLLQGTAQRWEDARRAKDPNFDKKLPLIERELVFLKHTEGSPNTAEGVLDQLTRAYTAAGRAVRPAAPAHNGGTQQRRAIRPVMGGQAGGNAQPKPKSMLDVVQQTTDRMRAS